MNFRYHGLIERTQRIIRELKEMEESITEALKLPHKHAVKMDRTRSRIRDATLHLRVAVDNTAQTKGSE